MFADQVIHFSGFEQATHDNIGLTDGRSCIVGIHLNKHLFAMHGLFVGYRHISNDAKKLIYSHITIDFGRNLKYNVIVIYFEQIMRAIKELFDL